MWLYVARRIAYAVPIALGVTIVCFSLIYLAPGDPMQSLLPADATKADIDLLRHIYGFDQPVPIQYLRWLARAASGDLGVSLQNNQPVASEVTHALANTIVIAAGAVVLAFGFAVALGTLAAFHFGRPLDRIATGVAILGTSVPNYWLGIVLVIVFAVQLGWLPATGMGAHGSTGFDPLSWEALRFAILPTITMTLVPLGVIMRSTRAEVSNVLAQDFVRMLYAKGLGTAAITRHALRNALPQVLAVMGLQFGYLVGGSILVETIFTWPGTGFLLSKAILTRDIPVLQGTILVLSLCFVLTNLGVDILQMSIDPRLRRA